MDTAKLTAAPAPAQARPGIVLWDEIGRARMAQDVAQLDMLPLQMRVSVAGADLYGRARAGVVVGRARTWPMRYDVRLDDGAVLNDVEARRITPEGRR